MLPTPSWRWTDSVLDPDILTIGFARRVPTYKRLTLMLREPERLKALLLHKTHPIQLVIAGKSHPADDAGKKMIQDLVRFTDDPAVRHRIVFLPNYDIAMARTLFPGCDVWLNNPLRPLEACGTSGMKAAINGSLNLSVLDGWWDEMYDGENGWAIPTANNDASAEERDDIEAAALYELLETQVAPRFYGLTPSPRRPAPPVRRESGPQKVPTHWVSMIKHTCRTWARQSPRNGCSRTTSTSCTGPPRSRDGRRWRTPTPRPRPSQRGSSRVRAAWPQHPGGARGLRGRLRGPADRRHAPGQRLRGPARPDAGRRVRGGGLRPGRGKRRTGRRHGGGTGAQGGPRQGPPPVQRLPR